MTQLPTTTDSPAHARLLEMAQRVARVGGWIVELPSQEVKWSALVARMFGFAPEVAVDLDTVLAHCAPAEQGRLRDALRHSAASGTPFDVQAELSAPHAEARWVRVIGEAVQDNAGRIVRLQGAAQDISEQRRMELALAHASERLTSTLERISDAFFMVDRSWRFTYTNHEAERLLQHSRESLRGRVLWQVFPEAVHTAFHTYYTRAMTEQCALEFEAHYTPFDNWYAVKVYPVPDGLVVYFRDATELRRASQQLRLLQSSVERLNDIVVITDAEPIDEHGPRIVYVNEAFERLTGYARHEVIGRTPRFLQGPATDRRTLDHIREALRSWQPVRAEVLNYTKSGDELWLELDIVPLADETGWFTHWVAVERDVTERRRLQQQVLRAQRLESVGTLAGGIAHDLNNVLSPILMSVELLQRRITDAESVRRLAVIGQAASRGASMIRQVLDFARGMEGDRRPLAVGPIVEDTLRIVGETFPRNIAVRADVSPDAWMIEGDPTQLQQVLLNLLVNARDAMPDGGTLALTTDNVVLGAEDAARTLEAREGGYVRLRVHDTGTGIAPLHLDKIFDPFFTTKPPGQGTGLGLSTTQAIVTGHGGFLRVSSELGRGTCVDVFLPVCDAPLHAIAETDGMGTPPRGAGETILVVDDEALIRATTREALEAHGYRVLEAPDGAAAIVTYTEHVDTIALVVTDLMMPVMDGAAMIQLLRQLAPSVRIVAVSGLATSREARQAVAQGETVFLAKPYTAHALLHTVARVLQAPATSS
jgi:two-component system cell cycle sensor histidine kinase/response regulator CckA